MAWKKSISVANGDGDRAKCCLATPPKFHSISKIGAEFGLAGLILEDHMLRTLCVAAAVTTFGSPVLAEGCERWNTKNYFHTVSAEEVANCLSFGANVEAQTVNGYSSLHIAAAQSKIPAVIEALIAGGADVNFRDKGGRTPLHMAASFSENPEILKVLIAAGADVNARQDDGTSPLHAATQRTKSSGNVEVMIAASANVNARDTSGMTALHYAALLSSTTTALEALIAAGADPTARNYQDEQPFDMLDANDAIKGTDVYWVLNDARFR